MSIPFIADPGKKWLGGVFIKKIFKQHRSLVMIIPPVLARAMSVKRGDWIVVRAFGDPLVVELFKWSAEGGHSNADCGRRDIENQGGRVRTEVGVGGGEP